MNSGFLVKILISMSQKIFDELFHIPLPGIDANAIWREWTLLKPFYNIDSRRLPLPVWARRGLTDNGEQAWKKLQEIVEQIDASKPFCIYIHIPFCSRKCSFCDCYSFRLENHKNEHIEAYLDTLLREIKIWSRLGSLPRRQVSTVHLGGGTPTFLGENALRRIVSALHDCFGIDQQTEWALETTSSELTPEMFAILNSLGFGRLHLGIQSLDDPVRSLLQRGEKAVTVLDKLSQSLALGWVTSVDLIYGLPKQPLISLLDDISILDQVGVDGLSLYELQSSPHNRHFIERHGLSNRERAKDYFYLQAASQLIASLEYKKTFFNHFARPRDTNLYFSFPERNEDCLALGTIADGVFGDYHYRHPTYMAYCQSVKGGSPGLQGGLRQTYQENQLATLEVDVLSGRIRSARLEQILGQECSRQLLERWYSSALISHDPIQNGQWHLTSSGSWFAGELMADLAGQNTL